MNIKKLASEIAKREGKKTQARIGEIREVLAILSDILYNDFKNEEDYTTFIGIVKNGENRAKKTKTKRSTK